MTYNWRMDDQYTASNQPYLSTICVYAGSADRLSEHYLQSAQTLGRELSQRGICLVYGGGKTGLMGALADAVLENNGTVIGIVPENLFQPQLIHANLTRLEILPDIHKRKARMSELADGFIALPGGFGTLDELFETLTWAQIGIHRKPVGILNINGYYDLLLSMVDLAREEGFIYSEHRDLFITATEASELLDLLQAYRRPDGLERWVDRPQE